MESQSDPTTESASLTVSPVNAPDPPPLPEERPGRRRNGRRAAVALLLVFGLAAAGAIAAYWGVDYLGRRAPEREHAVKRVMIPRGASLQAIARTLESEGLVDHWALFAAYAARQGLGRKLQAGEYRLHTRMSLAELASALQRGSFSISVTIPEGFTVTQIGRLLVARGIAGSLEEFFALAEDPELQALAGVGTPSLEGRFFPDTYSFEEGVDAREAAERMIRSFQTKADAAFSSPTIPPGASVGREELIVLASMIQREARHIGEMPLIASVYYNRLRQGMRLECDATVRYALGDVWDRNLTFDDLKVDSPYNTYRHHGLPPGPICNPSYEALHAAAHPEESDYLFYVYRGDGAHEFTRTYAEHMAAVRKYLSGRGSGAG